jgi:RNA polymerase sigma factor (sigma-70 family)
MQQYANYIYQAAFGVLRNVKDAEDVAQEAFVQIYLSLPRYQRKGLKSWMVRITVNKSIDYKRKLARRNEISMEQDANAPPMLIPDPSAHTEQQVLHKEQQQLIERNVNTLPNNYREVIIAYYIEEKSYQQIALEQGVELKTVASKLHRAKLWMKKHWKEDDYS